MRAIALAHQNRNLAEFERVLRDYKDGASVPSPFFPTCFYRLSQNSPRIQRSARISPHCTTPSSSKICYASSNRTLSLKSTMSLSRSVKADRMSKQSKFPAPLVCQPSGNGRTQTFADDPGQGLPRRPRPGKRMPGCIRPARSRCTSCTPFLVCSPCDLYPGHIWCCDRHTRTG